ncbi:GNAT family N-acetyltransferase [Nocardioides jishulii]|uniref:GNAT family N-acetyltransferase n=1 Tax=Nocardioides jishulii TaxID=2575440 RepID=A0A4U2YTT3_9ACTN|nr:GNAT family N-acetyltransferase [Nocardioides jishulii]QCX29327.1 GNAT family N-acetyltransferase [Nocardioides jishulii]TKI64888.1 GNAT family N-acetyltransferase [Nocardioides jishulii]
MGARVAGAGEAATIARLLHDFNVEFEAPTPPVGDFTRRLGLQLGRDDVRAWLAEADGDPVGFALATLRPSPYYDGGIVLLEELYARPARRGTGVGTALMAALSTWVQEIGAGEVQINVDEVDVDTRRFYERLGFTNVEDGSRMLFYVRKV